jgi:hypothetical protein
LRLTDMATGCDVIKRHVTPVPPGRIIRIFQLRMSAPHPSNGTPSGSRDV